GLEVDVRVRDAELVELRLGATAVAAPLSAEHRDGGGVRGHASILLHGKWAGPGCRGAALRSAEAAILPSGRAPARGGVAVAAVHAGAAGDEGTDDLRIEVTVLVPFGDQHDDVGSGDRVLERFAVIELRVQRASVLDRRGVGGPDVGPQTLETHGGVEGG